MSSLSQNKLAMSLPVEVCTLNFYYVVMTNCHSIDCLFVTGSQRRIQVLSSILFMTESISIFVTAVEEYGTDILFKSNCFVCDGEHFHHPPCTNFCLARFLNDVQNHRFSSPYCIAQFACHYAAVIPLQVISLVFGLHRCCCVECT